MSHFRKIREIRLIRLRIPAKSVRFTLEGLQKSKCWLSCSVGSIIFRASYGAPRSIFWFLQRLCGETLKKKRAFHARGVVKCEKMLPMLRKNRFFLCFSWSVALNISHLNTPLRWNAYFLRGGESWPPSDPLEPSENQMRPKERSKPSTIYIKTPDQPPLAAIMLYSHIKI